MNELVSAFDAFTANPGHHHRLMRLIECAVKEHSANHGVHRGRQSAAVRVGDNGGMATAIETDRRPEGLKTQFTVEWDRRSNPEAEHGDGA